MCCVGARTDTSQQTNVCLGIQRQTCVATFNSSCLSRLVATKELFFPQSAYCKWRERYVTYSSDNEWDEFLLTDTNLCLKYTNRRRRWMHQLWESRTGTENVLNCARYWQFPDKFRECYRMNITFDYILDSVKNYLQVIPISESALKQKRNLLLVFGTYWLLW